MSLSTSSTVVILSERETRVEGPPYFARSGEKLSAANNITHHNSVISTEASRFSDAQWRDLRFASGGDHANAFSVKGAPNISLGRRPRYAATRPQSTEGATHRPSLQTLVLALAFLLALFTPAHAKAQGSPYFTLSTYKTFGPTDKPKIHLYTRNVPELEFRVYRVRDEEKFISSLSEMHSFGETLGGGGGPVEDIDEKTWLERFHDWKSDLRYTIKGFFRGQLSLDTRNALKEKQSALAQRSRIVGVAQFAQVPLLNDKQLVARWRQQVPPTFVSDSQVLPIEPLPGGMYLIEATDGHLKAYTLLMVSQTALITRTVAGQTIAYVVDRKTGAPVPNASVVLSQTKQPTLRQTTTSEGIAIFTAPPSAKPKTDDSAANAADGGDAEGATDTTDANTRLWVLARSNGNVALVAPWYSAFTTATAQAITAFTYTDRPVYRPGHTVHFKSVLRDHDGDKLILPRMKQVNVTITDDAQKTLFDKQLPVSAMGTVQGELDLPKDAALGNYLVKVGDADMSGTGSFHVEEYRKPEYQVRVTTARQRVLQGDTNQATLEAKYFFGEPVANAKVKYRIFQSAHYWWGDPSEDDNNSPALSASGDEAPVEIGYGADQNSETEGRLNADGKLVVPVPTQFNEKQHKDLDYVVEAGVTDEAGREITGRYRFLATYGTFHIHVEPLSYSANVGDQASFQVSATDYDGKPISTAVHLHLSQRTYSSGETQDKPVGDTDVTTGSDGKAIARVPVKVAGSIYVLASANTPEHRNVQDTTYLWVMGNGEADEYGDSSQQAQIIADKKSYAPGDTAHVTIISQVAGFHALVTATGYSAEFRKVLFTNGRTLTFDLPIMKDSQPNLTVDAVFLKDETVYQANKSLQVPPAQQKLDITVTPAATTFQPGQAALYDITARDASGQPVAAELSFGVVDEAIYSLYPDLAGDILKALYPQRYTSSEIENSLTYYFTGEAGLRNPLLAERHSRYRPQLAQVKPGNNTVAPKIRKAFPDTAYWQPDVHTDASGHARVSLNFPDSLTTWRATVRAVTADSKAGSMVNRVIVRKNLIVRMGQPRFLRKGDTVTVPVIVHNYLTEPKRVQISLEASGVEIASGIGQTVTIAPRAEATVNYKLHASAIGTATLTAKALSSPESDALEISLPVNPSGVAETIAASGALTGSAEHSQAVNFPSGTDAAAHSLSVQVSPSVAGSLFSALDYLTAFPYGCTEQTMSSFLPNIIVAKAMQDLHVTGKIDQAVLNAKIDAGLKRLEDYHHSDGGWGWWKEDDSQVFMTAYVVSGLAQANTAGYKQAAFQIYSGRDFLIKILAEHPRMKPELRAYVVYALAESNSGDTANVAKQIDTLYNRRKDLSPQALAYTGLAMLDAKDTRAADIAHLLESKAKTEGELASWSESRNELLDIDYDGSAETTAFVAKFLAHADPQSSLLTKAAQWLVANRSSGYWWSSTQQTAFVIYGLTDYLAVSHELNADLDAEVFVNGASVGKRHFAQADVVAGNTLNVQLEATKLQPGGNNIRVVTHGSGRAYWSTQGKYFSTAKNSYQKGTMALNVARDYSLLVPDKDKDGHIVYRLKPLSGPVQQGDVLAVHIGITGSPQKYLMLEDPIPAGAEFIPQGSVDSYNIVDRPSTWDWWYTRQEFHDDRAVIFSTDFDRRHDSFYLLKVINPGSFAISPARVAPMYQPGIQATTDELHLDVKEVTQ